MSPQPLFSLVVALLSAEETDSFPNAPSTDTSGPSVRCRFWEQTAIITLFCSVLFTNSSPESRITPQAPVVQHYQQLELHENSLCDHCFLTSKYNFTFGDKTRQKQSLASGGQSKNNTDKAVGKPHLPCTLVNHTTLLPSYYSAGIGQTQSQLQRERER